MTTLEWINGSLGFMPVLFFLLGLQFLDSFKLVRFRVIFLMLLTGTLLAALTYLLNGLLLNWSGLEFVHYSRYAAPVLEEFLKAAVILYLCLSHRVGFLVDAAIVGFALGAGFAVAENMHYWYTLEDAGVAVWVVRGFGTAIMHGGVSSIFAILTIAIHESRGGSFLLSAGPGLVTAIVVHSIFNHFLLTPVLSALLVVVLLPPLLILVFQRSARSLHDWMELDFDADAELIQQLDSGDFETTKVGRYLQELRAYYDERVVRDMLCYLRIYTELSMYAKGMMVMRKHGVEPPMDDSVEPRFEEMRLLEKSIGRAGLYALQPFLDVNRRDLWHLNVLAENQG